MSFSVIIPVYNAEKYLEDAVHSVLGQTMTPKEIILIDDCSQDGSWSLMEELKEANPDLIRILHLDENVGPGVVRNKGIEMATFEYIAFLDSDDFWKKTKLEKQIETMKDKNLDLSYSSYDVLSEKGELKTIACTESLNFDQLLQENPIGTSSVVVRKSVLSKQAFPDLRRRQDWACWLMLLKSGAKFGGLEEVLVTYRERRDSVSRSGVRFERKLPMLIKYRWKVYEIIDVNYFKRVGLIFRFMWRAYRNKFRAIFGN